MARGVGGDSPSNIQKYLHGVNYPTDKDHLISKAQQNQAPKEVLDILQKLPANQFGGPQDVMKAYGQVE